jgi:hypothetical protein
MRGCYKLLSNHRSFAVTANHSKCGSADNLIPNVNVNRRWEQPSRITSPELPEVDVASPYKRSNILLGDRFNNFLVVLSS